MIEKSMKQILLEMQEQIKDEKIKKKSFSIPWMARISGMLAKKNYATVLFINDNRNIQFIKVPINEQTSMIDGCPRVIRNDDILFYKGKPFVIMPSWSVKPFSPAENYIDTAKEHYNSAGYKLLLNRMKMEQVEVKKSLPGWIIWAGIVVLIIGGYLAFKGGLFK